MTRDAVIAADQQYIMNTYGRLPLVPDHGKGAVIYDKNNKKYLDFTSGIGVNSLGYADEGWIQAVTQQAARFQHVSNYFYCEPASKLAQALINATGMNNLFFCNSGAEANEGAIKLARKYSFDAYGEGRSTIVTLSQSFHGRTVTTLAATGQDAFHQYFSPFTEGFRYCEAGDLDALKEACTEDVCAVMMELVQGEGGVNLLPKDYVEKAAAFLSERNILLILDEVQTGIGRTGTLFAYMQYGIRPDIVTSAKGLGGGLPIGAFLSGEKTAKTLGGGMHGSTFGANPLSTAAGCYVLSRLTDEFLAQVREKGDYLVQKIKEAALPSVTDVRHMGLMVGIAVKGSPKDYLHRAFDNGLLVLTAGKDVVRLLPPLSITREELDEGLAILLNVLRGGNASCHNGDTAIESRKELSHL